MAGTSTTNQVTSRLLPDKVVVITGASQGIGRAVAIGKLQADGMPARTAARLH
jgi:NADP-dependent 3-hydroxy acid dehydrogenase YdfG